MSWIKYDGYDKKTYPKETKRYRIKRDGKIGHANFDVFYGWAHLITVPDYYWAEEEGIINEIRRNE